MTGFFFGGDATGSNGVTRAADAAGLFAGKSASAGGNADLFIFGESTVFFGDPSPWTASDISENGNERDAATKIMAMKNRLIPTPGIRFDHRI